MRYQTAFITGASGGIGRALALHLGRAGLEVALAARRAEALEDLAREIRTDGGSARVYPLDVTNTADTVATVRRADDEMGGLDLVVANAGLGTQRWSGKLEYAEHVAPLVAVNVAGATATVVAVLPRMIERNRGHLVGISSLAQYRGLPKSAVYAGTKAYLSTFLEGVRVDVRAHGVAVTDVRPGFVRTEMTSKNEFPMPFILDADEAARVIWRGIQKRDAVVAFPWPLATVARSATMLPAAIYDRAVARAKV
jgi:short-subunit dehydrogenase